MSTNPILAGFHPDPSVCRVGDTYYLATSSFEYVPGVPIFRSHNLIDWDLVGHGVPDTRDVDAQPGRAGASAGLFAPTLRHHDGRFWLATTSFDTLEQGQLIAHADVAEGPWSRPVMVHDAVGIDPDLAWDDDGRCWMTWRGFSPLGIHQVQVDPVTGARLGPESIIWDGTDLADSEGPHLIRRGDWWYLLVAEGGTHTGHAVSVGRSRSPQGPFESNPHNPILTHASRSHPVAATGHADLVERPDGSWAMVYLGIRQSGSFPKFHVNGRETFLAAVEWRDDWPVVLESGMNVHAREHAWIDDFDDGLDLRWVAPAVDPSVFTRVEPEGGLTLAVGRASAEAEQRQVLCARVTDLDWYATAQVVSGDACLSLRIDADHWYGVEKRGSQLSVRAVSAPFDQVFAVAEAPPQVVLALRADRKEISHGNGLGPDVVDLGFEVGGEFMPLAQLDGRHLSTEVAGGFTGRMLGLEALDGECRIGRVTYQSLPVAPTS